MMIRQRKVLWYILLSYAVVTLIPFVALGWFTFGTMSQFYEEEILTNRVGVLQLVQNDFDMLVKEMNTNALQMLSGNDFSTSYLKSSYGNMYDVQRQLVSVNLTSSYLYDVMYCNRELETVYTTETAFSYDRFINYSKSSPLAGEDPGAVLLPNHYTAWIPMSEGENKLFAYVVTDKRGNKYLPQRSIIYVIESSTLDALFGSHVEQLSACIVMQNDGLTIYASQRVPDDIPEWKTWADKAKNGELVRFDDGGSQWAVYQNKSLLNSLTYSILIPQERILSDIEKPVHKAILVFGAVILLIGCAILFFTVRSYAPVRAVSDLAMENIEGGRNGMNEIQLAQYALQTMRNERAVRRKEKALVEMINSDAQKPCENLVFLILVEGQGELTLDEDDYREYASFLKENDPHGRIIDAVALPTKHCIFLSVQQKAEPPLGLVGAQYVHLLEGTFDVRCRIGVGLPGASLADAYNEALKKIEEQIQMEQNVDEDVAAERKEDECDFPSVTDIIRNHYSSPDFSAKMMASEMNMSLSNFSHYFKKTTGRTFSEYLSALRLEKAKNLLRTTGMSQSEIAERCGYLNLSAFMRSFKKQTGITPGTFRESYRE